jgi:hypothetical protein
MSRVFYNSAELRWFLRGQEGQWDQFLKWFRHQEQLAVRKERCYEPKDYATDVFVKLERQRKDKYLLFPDSDTVGVKQRNGNLEVKALVAGPRPFSLPTAAVAGRIDQWVKWSFATRLSKELEPELDRAAPWCLVAKDRYLQKYSCDSGRMVPVSPDAYPDCGCNIELTTVTINADAPAWNTLGFEAFGPSGRVMATLDEAVAQFFIVHGRAPVSLEGRDSLSYPTWLAMNYVG